MTTNKVIILNLLALIPNTHITNTFTLTRTYTQICAGLYRGISQYNNNPAATKRSIECFILFTLSHYALIKYMAEASA